MTGREPMTHDIVRNVLLLITRLGKHKENHEQGKNERRLNELNLLSEVLHALPAGLFDALSEKCDKLPIAKRPDGIEFYLLRVGESFSWAMSDGRTNLPDVLNVFTLEEVLSGLVTALADRVEARHEAGRKIARINRRLRGVLSILDNS